MLLLQSVEEVDFISLSTLLLMIFFLVESLVEFYSMFRKKEFTFKNGLAFLSGAFFFWFFGLDVFALLEVTPAVNNEWVILITSLVISGVVTVRYSGLVNGALGKFGEFVQKKKLG